jgi:lysozyme family protein
MTTTPAPKKPPQARQPANAGLKQLPFAFPFLRKGQGKSETSSRFTNEHDVYRLLAECEPSGSYLVSNKGMWHGGIHVTEAGAGRRLDLDAGVRAIAEGHLIAFRANRTYPVSEVSASDGQFPVQAPYSTGFALVRHTMEFPKGTTLTFYSLYMHLMSDEDYANFPEREKPAYWLRQWQVTEFAQDRPLAGRSGRVADAGQQGLRVRSRPQGDVIGILPQGASVSIGKRDKGWGQVKDLHGSSLYPPVAGGFVSPSAALGGWIYLGKENGGPLVQEVMPNTGFDRVVITASAAGGPDELAGACIPIKAGELIGHLGRYDSLNQGPAGTRMVHVEVFCDDGIKLFIEQGRAWVEHHGPHKEDWAALGLPADPTLLRIAPRTKLYHDHDKNGEGADALVTDVIKMYSLAELGRDKNRQFTESQPDASLGRKARWWHVESANALGNPIDGWVREYNHASGRVTREFAQKWVDFRYCEATHDPAHTIFATAQAWVDYASGADVPHGASRSRLSRSMQEVYGALFTKGDGSHAADELCTLAKTEKGQYPWLMQASSRLIVKHESEWANPAKWQQLIAEVEKQTEPKPQHAEEQKRIDKLAWWDEVKAGVAGFPGPEVFHINPIGLVANFVRDCDCATKFKTISAIILRHEGGYVNRASDKGGATNRGIAWNTWQAYAQEDLRVEPTLGNLKKLTSDQAAEIYLKRYWEPKGFCKFNDMRLALMVYDWTITSGGAAKQIQIMLNDKHDANIEVDGVMGEGTVDALNKIENQQVLLNVIADLRRQYYTNITIRDPSQIVNLNGWLNRVDNCLKVEV